MESSSWSVKNEIQKLIENLNEDNYDSVIKELSQCIEHGTKESILLVRTCLDHFKISEKDLKSRHLEPAVASLFKNLMEKPHFSEVFSGLMRHTTINEEFLDTLSTALQLSANEKIGFGLALLDSDNNDVVMAGRNFCMVQLGKVHATHASSDTADYILDVLRFLEHSKVLSKYVDSFMQMILQVFTLDPPLSEQLNDPKSLRHPWLCADLLEILCHLAERDRATYVRSLLENPLKHCPEALLLGMAKVMTPYNLIQYEVSLAVLPLLLKDAAMSGVILQLWDVNPLFFSRSLNDAVNLDRVNMNRVVDLLQMLEILLSVLDVVPMALGIRLAALASSKEFIDLEEWLSTNLTINEDVFFEECLRFLKEVEVDAQDPESSDGSQNSVEIRNLYKESAPTFFKVLQLHTVLLSMNQLFEELENIDGSDSSKSQVYEGHIETQANPGTDSSKSQVSVATSTGSVSIQKPQSVVRSSATMASSPDITSPSRALSSARFGFALSIGTLLAAAERRETPIETPPSEIQHKISFIMNNLSVANIEAKAKEFVEILEEKYHPWFAQYIVMKRVSIEPNFHSLYLNFLEKVNSKHLNTEIVQSTYENCKVLLRSDLIKSSAEERSLLKNLGGWLGKITIGRNQVLLAKQIDPKSLIIEAYEKGLMIGMIPFTSKILESCRSSLAYQPPNPWTMAILGFFAEIHAMPNLKMNLKFEIEVLFRNLDIDLKAVTPTSLLKDRVRRTEGNPDFFNKDVGSSQQKIVEVNSTMRYAGSSYQHTAPLHLPRVTLGEDEKMATLGLSDQLPPAQGLQSPSEVSQLPAPTSMLQQVNVNRELRPENYLLHMHIQRVLPMAMDNAIKEIVSTIVQRTVSIATQTTMNLVLKDYITTEPDEDCIRRASFLIVDCLAGNFSYVICKEPLRSLMSTQLRKFLQGVNISNEILGHVIDNNLESCCASVVKAATEKGLIIVERELAHVLSVRRKHREGAGPATFNLNLHPPLLTIDVYELLSKKLEFFIANNAKEAEIQSVIAEVHAVVLRCINKDEAALAVARKVFEGLYENAANSIHVDIHLVILAAMCDVSKLVRKELTSWVLYSDDDRKFNKDITVAMIHRELLDLAEYNLHMAKLIYAGKNGTAIEFSISLVRTLQNSYAGVIHQLQKVVDALTEVTKYRLASRDNNIALESSGQDPHGFHEQVEMLLADWCRICQHPGANDSDYAYYVLKLKQNVLSKSDDMPDRFFHVLLEITVSHSLPSERINPSPLQFYQQADPSSSLLIGIYVDLVFVILKFYPVDQGLSRQYILSKVLAVIVRFIMNDAEEKKASFNSKPYFKLFINFFLNISTLDKVISDAKFQVLTALSNSFHALQPSKVPVFSFAWVELVSHKDFMPKLLTANGLKGWSYYERLMVDLLQFMEPFLTTNELGEAVHVLYKGTLRVVHVLLNDFPEFLCYNYFNFCDVIAPHCFHLRNIILSVSPRNVRIPDPTTPNLKVDLLHEMSQPPLIFSEFDAALMAHNMKIDLDEYLTKKPERSLFLSKLRYKLLLSSSEAEKSGTRYNVPLMNSLVLYVGTKAIEQLQASHGSHGTSIARSVQSSVFFVGVDLDIFRTLILELPSEGRYLLFNSVANHLRYPNNHTHYFSFVLLYFFLEINKDAIQEQITRVLLERLSTNRPHPWGVVVTFLELVKNPRYNFWNLSFTRCQPEIKRVFDSVSRSCENPRPEEDDGMLILDGTNLN